MMQCHIPNESAPRVAYQTKEHQKTNENVKQQQAKVPQPPVIIHRNQSVLYKWRDILGSDKNVQAEDILHLSVIIRSLLCFCLKF